MKFTIKNNDAPKLCLPDISHLGDFFFSFSDRYHSAMVFEVLLIE